MMIDFVASRRHFVDHLTPIIAALGPNVGLVYTTPALVEYVQHRTNLEQQVATLSQPHLRRRGPTRFIQKHVDDRVGMRVPKSSRPTVTAAIGDVSFTVWSKTERPIALLEHGCGMSFSNTMPNHPGGNGMRGEVSLFLMPNVVAGQRDKDAHPKAATVVCGCPKLDIWFKQWSTGKPPSCRGRDNPVVAFVFHWDSTACPETRSTWDEYKDAVQVAMRMFPNAIGHCHPRAWDIFEPEFQKIGLEPVADFEDVMSRADLLGGDGGSAPYEFAVTGKPVVVRNSKHYRRDVNHGIRFWDFIPGLECDDPDDLVSSIQFALADALPLRRLRDSAVKAVYTYTDGDSTARAKKAILGWAALTS